MKKSIVTGVAGAVRVDPLTLAELDKQEKHGKRIDTTSQARRISDDRPVTTTGLDLCALYAAHTKKVFVPKAKTKALHVLIQFPRDLVDPDDAEGLLGHAREFGKRVWGDEAIFADRYDRDEKSKGVVDLFVAPKYLKKTKRDPEGRIAVSMTRHNKLLAKKHGRDPTKVWDVGKSLQDELHEYLRDVMGLKGVKRGSPKVFAGPDWKSAEQLRMEELEEENRRLEKKAADLDALAAHLDARESKIQAKEDESATKLADREAGIASRERQLEADEVASKRHRASVAIEAAQAKLLLRAGDDEEGLDLRILETGKPKMNEAAMDESERMAYRSAWSERMLELARFVARTLQVIRDKVAAAVRREKAAEEREAAVREAHDLAQHRLEAASAAQEGVEKVKAIADAFMAAWQRIPEAQRSPPVRDAILKADALLAPDKRPQHDSKPAGSPKSAAEAMAALRGLTRGPNDGGIDHLSSRSRSTGRDGAPR